jgi:hypothetical protein
MLSVEEVQSRPPAAMGDPGAAPATEEAEAGALDVDPVTVDRLEPVAEVEIQWLRM